MYIVEQNLLTSVADEHYSLLIRKSFHNHFYSPLKAKDYESFTEKFN